MVNILLFQATVALFDILVQPVHEHLLHVAATSFTFFLGEQQPMLIKLEFKRPSLNIINFSYEESFGAKCRSKVSK